MNAKVIFVCILAATATVAQTQAATAQSSRYAPSYYGTAFDDASGPFDSWDSFYGTFIEGRLHLGLSYAKISMDKTSTPHEKAFLGNIDTLKEDDTGQFGFTVKYDFCDYLAILFADDMRAELSAWNYDGASTDGSLILDGYTLQLLVQYPFEIQQAYLKIVPYVGLGYSWISARWSYASWWHWGWSEPEDYEKYGNGEQKPHNGYSRWMLPEDPSTAFTWALGIDFTVYGHLGIDFFYRVVDLDDIDTDFRTHAPDGRLMREGSFPASFSAYGVALRYVF